MEWVDVLDLYLFVSLFSIPATLQCIQTESGTPTKQPGVLCSHIYPLDSFPPKPPLLPDIFTVSVETVNLKASYKFLAN